jgi:hypothetical protein
MDTPRRKYTMEEMVSQLKDELEGLQQVATANAQALARKVKILSQALENQKQQTEDAQDRIFDMLLGDDGQAWREAEEYLRRKRPDLHQRLQER